MNMTPALTEQPKKDNTAKIVIAVIAFLLTVCISLVSVVWAFLGGNEDLFSLAFICLKPFGFLAVLALIVWLIRSWIKANKAEEQRRRLEEAEAEEEAEQEMKENLVTVIACVMLSQDVTKTLTVEAAVDCARELVDQVKLVQDPFSFLEVFKEVQKKEEVK